MRKKKLSNMEYPYLSISKFLKLTLKEMCGDRLGELLF